ncbi:FkbM family methyltransferase [Pseudomonas corrugata]|uniref:FkbM family methyltransferase n=1 Tax=Pseudomonas corrugata TaxID=47879 RepID=UPI0028C50D7C|nr:FkbM family methyltransferase [Pseudomonas corrugata]MDU9041539.1 FkbM family methyltransferase [Pseudomonas corrugata]
MRDHENADLLQGDELIEGHGYQCALTLNGKSSVLKFRFDSQASIAVDQEVVLRSRQHLDVLKRLGTYPAMARLLSMDSLDISYEALERQLDAPVYIFGAHQVGVLLARLFASKGGRVQAFFDNDVNKHNTTLDGIKVQAFDPSSLPGNALIVLGSGRYSAVIQRDLEARGWSNFMTMQQFLAAMDAPYITEASFRHYRSNVIDERLAFISAFLCLDDERSREVFDGLMTMRLDLAHADAKIRSDFTDEYLEPAFINADDLRHYVDAGAYNGDTLSKIESRFGPVQSACLFEPEQLAFLECQAKFGGRSEVVVLRAAMTEVACQLSAPASNSCDVLGALSSGHLPGAPAYVPGIPLDDTVSGDVTLIKLDIEGNEQGALRGARQVIQRVRPKLCVCAYHRGDDLWKLIDTVLSIRGDYKVGVRHYSDIVDDTTLYFY